MPPLPHEFKVVDVDVDVDAYLDVYLDVVGVTRRFPTCDITTGMGLNASTTLKLKSTKHAKAIRTNFWGKFIRVQLLRMGGMYIVFFDTLRRSYLVIMIAMVESDYFL